jgi:hypothetical protein
VKEADVLQECDGLHGFPQTHLVSEDAVLASVPVVREEVHPLNLVRLQL